eukprot:Nk52_evm1s1356 gene=Nk52_evmTU1s1356
MKILGRNNVPAASWCKMLVDVLSSTTRRLLKKSGGTDMKVWEIGHGLLTEIYNEDDRRDMMINRLGRLEKPSSFRDLLEKTMDIYRCFGLYEFKSLRRNLGKRLDISLAVELEKMNTIEEIDKFIIRFSRDGQVPQRREIHSRNFQVQEDPLVEEDVSQITRNFKLMKNLKL